jgi:hypothetical protein
MTETEGCAVLRGRFEAAGLKIVERFPFDEPGLQLKLDGFDPLRRVGYEYVTTEAGDRAEVTPPVLSALEERNRSGDLKILLVDEADIASPEELAWIADRFLQRVLGSP